jgi:putative transcriptional regulator
MTDAGRRLLQAASEALLIAKGEADQSTYVVHAPPTTVDVRQIRMSLNMTQVAFGERFGFGKARVRDWEQARTTPAASDRVLLTTIKYAPEVVLAALENEAKPQSPANISPQRREGAKARPRARRSNVA